MAVRPALTEIVSSRILRDEYHPPFWTIGCFIGHTLMEEMFVEAKVGDLGKSIL